MGEKQKLQMEIEEQRAAIQENERREAEMKQEAKNRDEEIKVGKRILALYEMFQVFRCVNYL